MPGFANVLHAHRNPPSCEVISPKEHKPRSILDTAPAAFLTLLKSKAEEAGSLWVEVPTRLVKPSQTCHRCGIQRKKLLSERRHVCACGADCSRDENAARVMLNWALFGNATGREPSEVGSGGSLAVLNHETNAVPDSGGGVAFALVQASKGRLRCDDTTDTCYTTMQRKLTITIDEAVYEGLQHTVGRGHISRFLENLARPFVLRKDMEAAYREMAADEAREAEALEWSEGLIGDTADDAR